MSLTERIAALEAELNAATARTADEVEQFRVAMLGRNGVSPLCSRISSKWPPRRNALLANA
jgi:hypothetical protein